MFTRTVKKGMVRINGWFFAPSNEKKDCYVNGDRLCFDDIDFHGFAFRTQKITVGVLSEDKEKYIDFWSLVSRGEENDDF